MSKKITEFTFEEARSASVQRIAKIADFMENLNCLKPKEIPVEWAILLRTLELKIQKSSSPCLKEWEVEQIIDLAYQLSQANPEITNQLTEFLKLHIEILNSLKKNPLNPVYKIQGIIQDNWSEIITSDSNAENLVLEINRNKNSTNYTTINAILNSHLGRTEKIEHFIRKQLQNDVKNYYRKGYDIESMCSIRHKVKKGNGWRTDVRAIRDSIAHYKYKIIPVGDSFDIAFDNDEEGYNFHESFSAKEFYHFFDLYTVLYKIQLHLLIIIELLPVLATCLLKEKPLT